MDLYNAIIIGSGPAGTFSAYALRGCKVLVLDVGYRPPALPQLEENLYALRQQREDMFHELIGEDFESLHNLHQRNISLKLKSPFMSYVARNQERLSPLSSDTFESTMSFALGGLANAWGAGVYRFDDRDLDHFPIAATDLEPYYNELTEHIGISGANDDLAPHFGHDRGLLPPLRMTRLAADLLDRFARKRAWFQQAGITLGRPRLAVLTQPHHGRCPYNYDNLEFFRPYNPAIYNPVYTLDDLVASGQIELQTGWLAISYMEHPEYIEVTARSVDTGEERSFHAKRLILAAGALNSAKIVLQSNADFDSRLPILDNSMVCIPLFRLGRIGAALDVHDGAMAQLNMVYDPGPGADLLQASIYGTTGPLRSDVLFQLPLSISANVRFTKYLAPAMTLLMLFGPGERNPANYLRLTSEGELYVAYHWKSSGVPERKIIRAFRKIGFLSHSALCQYPKMGSSIHYAGTLPMKKDPGRYETAVDGRLSGTKRVYVTDGACFTALPAKNLTLTIMANAMRIATRLRRDFE
jgi:choline dehydrogenase-like flavoprotein